MLSGFLIQEAEEEAKHLNLHAERTEQLLQIPLKSLQQAKADDSDYNMIQTLLILLLIASIAEAQNCTTSCGSKSVQYPFGFSDGCKIRLNCSNPEIISTGKFTVQNITSSSIFLKIPAKCNRSIESMSGLFGPNFGPTWNNSLLFQSCLNSQNGCYIPAAFVEKQFALESCKHIIDSVSCFAEEKINGSEIVEFDYLLGRKCKFLYSSIAVLSGSKDSPLSLEFETIELGWWVDGSYLDCADKSTWTNVTLGVERPPGIRCQCSKGFHGDGFRNGSGCRRVSECSGLRYMSGRCGGRVGILIAGAVAGVAVLVVAVLCFREISAYRFIFFWKLQNKRQQTVEAFLRNYEGLQVKRYSYLEVKKMTYSFKEKLGQGGYGGVFKGKLIDGRFVAVKILNRPKGDGEDFMNEVAAISTTSHVNIVSLLGFCFEGSKRALIYEFMPNGSLEKFIFDAKTPQKDHRLGWDMLERISLGIAQGLEYLHRGCSARILHFDIKPHNILLDKNFLPKISDFGLAKICDRKESIVSMLGARGTCGYIAPEVCCRNFGGVSHKSDVYSYGMMLSEMAGGRRNINVEVENTSEIYFPHWIYHRLELDQELGLQSVMNEEDRVRARKMIIVSLWCIQTNPSDRPSMKQVIEMLEGSVESLQIPPKPYLTSPPKSPTRSSTTSASIQIIQ